jgi:LEA14-like dessication related protein
MHLRRIFFLLSAFSCLVFTGCNSSKNELGEIGISLVDVKAGSGSGETVVTLRFVNENIVPFGITSSTHRLQLNSTPVGRVINNASFGIAAMSMATRDFVLEVENVAALQQWLGAGRSTGTSYLLESELIAMRGDSRHRLRSQISGTLSAGQ